MTKGTAADSPQIPPETAAGGRATARPARPPAPPRHDGSVTATRDPGALLAASRVKLGAFEYEIGPLGHLAAERQRLERLSWRSFDATPVSATIGAEIRGVALGDDLPDAVVADLRQALLDYKVLFFRDQPITAGQHVGFARRFGELEVHPFIPANGEFPELVRFAKSADVGGYENGWHSDVSWRAAPSMAAVLHAVEVPPSGGDTLFADMYAAYEGLSEEQRAPHRRPRGGARLRLVVRSPGPARTARRDPGEVPAGRAPGGAHAPGDRTQAACT